MSKWAFALIIASLFGGVFYGATNWSWWACVCAGLLSMWLCTLIFMAVTHAILNSKKNLLQEIERHEKLEERLVEDIVSLIELYNYHMPNSNVVSPEGATDKLHKAMEDINEYLKHRSAERETD